MIDVMVYLGGQFKGGEVQLGWVLGVEFVGQHHCPFLELGPFTHSWTHCVTRLYV